MKILKSFSLLILLGLSALSCKSASSDDTQLKLVVANRVTILPVDLSTCKSATSTVAAPSFEIKPISYQWQGTNDLTIQYISIEVSGGNLSSSYKCVISGDELKTTLYPATDAVFPGGKADTIYKSTCGLRCGGVPIPNNVSNAYLTGRVKVVGMQVDADGITSAVSATADVNLEYTAL